MEWLNENDIKSVSGGDAWDVAAGSLAGGGIGATGVGTIVGTADAVVDYNETLDE